MDRRSFGLTAGVGIGGLLFPQKSEGESDRPVLEGLTDLEMAAAIGEFPQKTSALAYFAYKKTLNVWEMKVHGSYCSYWTIEGTIIHSRDVMPVTFDGKSIQDGWSHQEQEDIDITSLENFLFHSIKSNICHYKRKCGTNNVMGWFLVGK